MSDLSMSQFLNKADLEAAQEKERQEARQAATVASRLTHAKVVTKLEESGYHWTFTAKKE